MNWNDPAVVAYFKDLWPGPLVRQSGWLFPFGESMHFIGLCLLFGSLIFVDLRLMGFFKELPVKSTLTLVPYAILGLVINMASGWLFFTSAPGSYLENPAFILKMFLVLVATLNAIAFTIWEHRKVSLIGPGESAPRSAQILAGSSLFLWLFVLLLGRWLPIFTIGTN